MRDNLVVRETEDSDTCGAKPSVPDSIAFGLREVTSAVRLDNETDLLGEEVSDVGPEGLLPTKLDAIKSSGSKMLPEQTLGGRRCAAQPASPKRDASAYSPIGRSALRIALIRTVRSLDPSPSGRGDATASRIMGG